MDTIESRSRFMSRDDTVLDFMQNPANVAHFDIRNILTMKSLAIDRYSGLMNTKNDKCTLSSMLTVLYGIGKLDEFEKYIDERLHLYKTSYDEDTEDYKEAYKRLMKTVKRNLSENRKERYTQEEMTDYVKGADVIEEIGPYSRHNTLGPHIKG